MSFTQFGLPEVLVRAVADLGFDTPTPIQSQAIAPAASGRDLVACAATGSGKTAAFVLPMLARLLATPARPGRGPRALILAPTRELAAQIGTQIEALGRHTRLASGVVFGGVSAGPQERLLRHGVDVVVATPGRLLDHLGSGIADLSQVEILILDEADRMLDMGFLPDIRRVLAKVPRQRQTLLVSATMPPPIVQLSREILRDPVHIGVERQSRPAASIDQAVYPVPEDLKPALLIELLRRETITSAIVFTRTKHRANRLAEILEKAGIDCARIHGNRSQSQRTEALDRLRAGKLRVLVATDIAARGIDVEALSHVVNIDVPVVPEDYVHRIGRTGRAEATGEAFTFVDMSERNELAAIERVVGRRLPRIELDGFDYRARAAERFEVPIAERIAAIRARKAEERARAKEKEARRAANAGHHGTATNRGSHRPAEAPADRSRAAAAPSPAGDTRPRRRRRRGGRPPAGR